MLSASRLHKVLNQCLSSKNHILEARQLFQTVHEEIHTALRFGKWHLAHLCPIFITLVHHVGLLDDLASAQAEQTWLNGLEVVLGVFGGTLHLKFAHARHQCQLHRHVIIRQYPSAVWQLFVVLHNVQMLHEVHACLLR